MPFCNAKDRLLLFKCETTLHKRHIQGVWKIREYKLNRIKKGCAKQFIAHPFLYLYTHSLLWINLLQQAVSVSPLVHKIENEADINTNTTC